MLEDNEGVINFGRGIMVEHAVRRQCGKFITEKETSTIQLRIEGKV